MNPKINVVALFFFAIAFASACAGTPVSPSVAEQPVTVIPLAGPIADRKAELSGLAWYGNMLILLPQYPDRFGKKEGALFAIPKQQILDFLDGQSARPITPSIISFSAPGLKEGIHDFEGYEAIGFSANRVYLTVEAGKNQQMMGYLVGGDISADLHEIDLDTTNVIKIPPQVLLNNRADEALIVTNDQVMTFFEVNGAQQNPGPMAHVFGLDLSPQGTIAFPHLEYRVTDATLDSDSQIWIINKLSPKDTDLLSIADPLAIKYGTGKGAHKEYPQVERLVPLNHSASGITLADLPPIPLQLIQDPRNWEGLVALDQRGFLLVTDKSPETLLAFVPRP